MYEIEIAELATDNREFHFVKDAILDRYSRIHARHAPHGPLTRRRKARQREVVASAYTIVIANHAATVADAFRAERYASGFALVRPMLEALLKQALLTSYEGDDDGWKSIPDQRIRVTSRNLTDLAARAKWPDLGPLWRGLSPWLNDFVHGGRGQLISNPVNENSRPAYPGDWVWTATLTATIAALSTYGWLWAHLEHEERCQMVLNDMAGEDWGSITVPRNGQTVRIVGPRTDRSGQTQLIAERRDEQVEAGPRATATSTKDETQE